MELGLVSDRGTYEHSAPPELKALACAPRRAVTSVVKPKGIHMNSWLSVALSLAAVFQWSIANGLTMIELTDEHSDQLAPAQTQRTCCPIVELRQYTLHPGKRDTLIELFDREFITSQEAVGMTVIGQFRDLDNPDRFVWLRGFPDMTSRAKFLAEFYGGPVWKAHRQAANATMIDSDNVLLLRPARAGSRFLLGSDRPPAGTKAKHKGLVVATIYYFEAPVTDEFVAFFESRLKPALEDAGASLMAYFVTEAATNTFPALPVREGENVFVWLSRFRDQSAYDAHEAKLSRSKRWQNELSPDLKQRLKGKPDVLKLSPTEQSLIRG
jgi:quinol monooxygenase YgiN